MLIKLGFLLNTLKYGYLIIYKVLNIFRLFVSFHPYTVSDGLPNGSRYICTPAV